MELSNHEYNKLANYGWSVDQHGFTICDCQARVVDAEDCSCYQKYLHMVQAGDMPLPEQEERTI